MPLFPDIWMRRKVCAAFCIFLFSLFAPAEGRSLSHFPLPAVTNSWSEFYGTVKIDGVDAQPGDEIAFYDPAGTVCGSYVIQKAGEYGIVHVYGDDLTTADFDEGASPDDVLSVRLWDSRRQTELSGGTLQLRGGIPLTGSSFLSSPVPPIWQDKAGYALNLDTTSHFPPPLPTPHVANYAGSLSISGSPAAVGDEVAVFDQNGILCGHFRVNQPGQYGMIQIYGDDTTTLADEGAVEGDVLTFKVWQQRTNVEYTAYALALTAGEAQSSFEPSALPPRWQPDRGYILNIDVGAFTNSPPVAADGAAQASANTPVTGTLAATDPDFDPLTFRIVTNGSKGTVTIANAATGDFSYLPHSNLSGADFFTFVANDGTVDSNTATVNVTIAAVTVNHPPVAAETRVVTPENTPVTLMVSATDTEGDPLTYRLRSTDKRTIIREYFARRYPHRNAPKVHAEFSGFNKHGHLGQLIITNPATGEFKYTPDPGVNGSDFFLFDAFDGAAASKPAFIMVTISKGLNGDMSGDGFVNEADKTLALKDDMNGVGFVNLVDALFSLQGDMSDDWFVNLVDSIFSLKGGDMNDDGLVNLADAIIALQVASGTRDGMDYIWADVNDDGNIGLPEAIYILQHAASLR